MRSIGVNVPVIQRGSDILLMRSADFWHHRDEVLSRFLPTYRIKVVKWGSLAYEIKQPPIVERVAYPFTMPEPEEERAGFYRRGSLYFLRVSELANREGFIIRQSETRGITNFTVTFYGWADFTVHVRTGTRPVQIDKRYTHDPRTGERTLTQEAG